MKGMKAVLALAVAGIATGAIAGERIKVASEGGIREQWTLAGDPLAAPAVPQSLVERGDSVCIALGYQIGRDGTTGDFGVLKSWTSAPGQIEKQVYWGDVVQASANAVSQWKFKPREGQRVTPTYTVATLSFSGKGQISGAELREQCKVGDLAAFLQDAKATRFETGTIPKQDLERFRNNTRAAAAMVSNPGRSSNGL